MRKCPFCAEDIQDAAIVCKHCRRDLTDKSAQQQHLADKAPQQLPAPRPGLSRAAKFLIFLVLGIFLSGFCVALLPSDSNVGGRRARPGSENITLMRPKSERRIECEAPGDKLQYEAEFDPGNASNRVDTLQVTFRTSKPTSNEAESVLRRCLQAATTAVRIDYETLANTWFNDDGPLPLIDGSGSLVYDPKTSTVQTWNEREGVRLSQATRDGYTVEYQENKILVPPYGKFATIDVLFLRPREPAEILKVLAMEIATAVGKQPTKLDTTAWAKSGPEADRAARVLIRGRSGQPISAEFDVKSGQIRDRDDRVLRTIR